MDIKITVLASTKPGYKLKTEEAKLFGGQAAAICYMPDSYESILAEPKEKTLKRADQTIISGHHSVFDHPSYCLLLEGVPKIIAMILNNENMYTTSEKSARYTQMEPSEQEKKLYNKWLEIFKRCILSLYPEMDDIKVKKLAQENARYLISVFTPTTLEYTASLRQLNYIINWFNNFIAEKHLGEFFVRLRPFMHDFVTKMQPLYVPGLIDGKHRGLSLFDNRIERNKYFGETYCTTYLGSFAQLAQAHRHRTLDYKIRMLNKSQYFTPPIIANNGSLAFEWLHDIKSVSNLFPQGMMVSIRERGTYENFILKTKERLCSQAQLEISLQTWHTLQKYLTGAANTDPEVFEILGNYNHDSRCKSGFNCANPCDWRFSQLRRLV